MTAAPTALVMIFERARWLAGPLVDKELRVASRRRRYYLLRFAYVGLLVFVTFRFWYALVHVPGGTSGVVQVSRLATAGKGVIAAVVWFQFVASQVLAAVLLSDAISSEIRQRTLESLLVTPIGAVHIVLGKLLSRLLLLGLLLAISLPVLAVARVFGGVPWDYVVSGLCIALSGAVFAGSLSLLYSITYCHAYQAVLVVALWYLVVWGIFAVPVITLSTVGSVGAAPAAYVMSLINPIPAMVIRTQMVLGGVGGRAVPAPVLWHCLTMLAAAAVLLALAVRRVRRVALVGQWGASREATRERAEGRGTRTHLRHARRRIRRVVGTPIMWKELRTSVWGFRKRLFLNTLLWIAIAGVALPLCAPFGGLFLPLALLQGLLVLRLAVAAGSAVTREKEARTWPLLLSTPLDEREIVKGKAVAVFRENEWLLLPLLALYLLIGLLGRPSNSILVSFTFLFSAYLGLAGAVLFLLGLGLYMSTRLKTTTGAVVATLGLYLVPKLFWGVPGPWLLLMARSDLGAFRRPVTGTSVAMSVVPAALYAVVGWACLRAATRRLRRDVF